MPEVNQLEFVNALPIKFMVMNYQRVIVAISDEFLAFVGKDREDVVGRYSWDVFPENPADPNAARTRASTEEAYEKVLTEGVAVRMPPVRYDVQRADGTFEERYWTAVYSPMQAASGERFVVTTFEDVTKIASAVLNMSKLESSLVVVSESLRASSDIIRELLQDFAPR